MERRVEAVVPPVGRAKFPEWPVADNQVVEVVRGSRLLVALDLDVGIRVQHLRHAARHRVKLDTGSLASRSKVDGHHAVEVADTNRRL